MMKIIICEGKHGLMHITLYVSGKSIDGTDGNSLLVRYFLLFKESALRPILSSSRDVRLSVCLFVPFPCDFFQGLLLALRSHDQIPASQWSTHPSPPNPSTFNLQPSTSIKKRFVIYYLF